MALHIGIVGCSAEGAALCYRTICLEGSQYLGSHGHPQVSMHTHSLADYMTHIDRADWHAVADLMLDSARRLARAGAQLLICPDNTIHQAFQDVRPRSPLPWLHIARIVAERASARGFRRVGITGTRSLVESAVYPEALGERGVACVRPSSSERDAIDRIIFDELVRGDFKPESRACLQGVLARLRDEEGCEAVVLGCTELPLIIDDASAPVPTLDSTRLLARAALERAVSGSAD